MIPVDSDHDLNDACTETSSSEMSCDEQSVPAFESKGTRTFEPPVAPEGYEMWQHSKSKILHLGSLSRRLTFLSVAGGLELFTLTRTSTQGGTPESAGSVSNISDGSLFQTHFAVSRKS